MQTADRLTGDTYARRATVLVVAGLAIILAAGQYNGYRGRVALVNAQRQSCADDVRDRTSDIRVRATQAWATQRVADDRAQPARTRSARRVEAATDRASVRDRLTRIDQAAVDHLLVTTTPPITDLLLNLDTGRRLDCRVEHPSASLLNTP